MYNYSDISRNLCYSTQYIAYYEIRFPFMFKSIKYNLKAYLSDLGLALLT